MEEFNIDEKGVFHSSWNITYKIYKLNLTELITNLLSEMKSLLTQYETVMMNDGKLIGNEKISMYRRLETILQLLVFSRIFINKNYTKSTYSEPTIKIFLKSDTDYYIQGTINFSEIAGLIHLGDWLKQLLLKMITDYTAEVKQVLEDKVITVDEGLGLCKTLDKIIIKVLIAYYKMKYENINK
jgi:hypothetical protein